MNYKLLKNMVEITENEYRMLQALNSAILQSINHPTHICLFKGDDDLDDDKFTLQIGNKIFKDIHLKVNIDIL